MPVMLNPGSVVEVDAFTASMLMRAEKAEPTEEKLFINKDYVAPPRVNQSGDSGIGAALLATLAGIQNTLSTLQVAKAR